MSRFEKEWSLEGAMEILRHPTVDGKIWAEAVEWLLLNGPSDIREMLQQASNYATTSEFPNLKPQSFTADGEPVYAIAEVARELGITEEEAAEVIARKEKKHRVQHRFSEQETRKLQ